MEKLILEKLTATDIGIIIIAVCYLFERALLFFQKIYNMRTVNKVIKSSMPEECVKQSSNLLAILKRIEGTQKGTYRILKKLEDSHEPVDQDGVKKWHIKTSLYNDVDAIKEQTNRIAATLHRIESRD